MTLFEFSKSAINKLKKTTFAEIGWDERGILQRLLRENIEVISPSTLVIAEEFRDWADANRRIDLLGIDKDANLVVIELKRTEDGGHMDLQAIRYASMVSKMTFEKASEVFERHLKQLGKVGIDAKKEILNHLGWTEPRDEFAQEVRIVLAAADFGKEITTTAMWLRDYDIDIRCVRIEPYKFEERILVDVQTIIPLKETQDYQVRLRVRFESHVERAKRRTRIMTEAA